MKTYKKAKLIAKNLPTGSYAAGCPEKYDHTGGPNTCGGDGNCKRCERTK